MVLSLSPADTAGRFQVTDLDGNPLSPVVHQGRIGVDKESTIPQRVPSQVPLKLGLPENILVWVQIGNFSPRDWWSLGSTSSGRGDACIPGRTRTFDDRWCDGRTYDGLRYLSPGSLRAGET